MTEFSQRYGFDRGSVTLANWRQRPWNTWSFQHVGELVPSSRAPAAGIDGDDFTASQALPEAVLELCGLPFTMRTFLEHSESDCLLVSKGGKLRWAWQADHCDFQLPHIVFSITKSFTGLLLGIAEADGLLDTARSVSHYLPQARDSGYGDATVRDLLDMRVSIDFSEEYLNEDGDYARYRRAMLWNPPVTGKQTEGLADLLFSLGKGEVQHGGPFCYQSPNSDVLGILLEAVTGARYCDYLSQKLWLPMGAQADACMTVDGFGAPRGAGGLSVTAGDLMQFGRLILDGGAAGNQQIVPESWIADMVTNGDETAWSEGNFHDFVAGGRYRSQWYAFPAPSRAFMAVGIHGQWLYACPDRDVVIVKLASQSEPQVDGTDALNLAFLDAVASMA